MSQADKKDHLNIFGRSPGCREVMENEGEEKCKHCRDFFSGILQQEQGQKQEKEQENEQEQEDLPKVCPVPSCGRAFRRDAPYKKHMKIHEEFKRKFYSESKLASHKKRLHPQQDVRESVEDECDPINSLEDEIELEKVNNAAQEPKLKESTCPQYDKALQKHVKTHKNGEIVFDCSDCDQIFLTNEQLVDHKGKEHSNIECDQCEVVLNSVAAMKKHKRSQHKNPLEKCPECDKFVRKSSLSNHIKMVHQADEMRKHLCNICGKSYKTKTDLDRHYTKHTGQKQYTCPTCGKGFRFWGGLDDCQRRHLGDLRHTCTQCDKGFNSKFRLLLHMRTHSGARPFQCPCCNYDCSRKDNLLTHIRRSHRLTQPEAEILGDQKFLKDRTVIGKLVEDSSNKIERTENSNMTVRDEIVDSPDQLQGADDANMNVEDEPLDMSEKTQIQNASDEKEDNYVNAKETDNGNTS